MQSKFSKPFYPKSRYSHNLFLCGVAFDAENILEFGLFEVESAVLEILPSSQNWTLGSSTKNTPDETLFIELALRGYDLSRLRNEETTAEVVAIG